MRADNEASLEWYRALMREPKAVRDMLAQLKIEEYTEPIYRCGGEHAVISREHVFHPTRKWRFDFALVPAKVALEIEGLVWSPESGSGVSRHTDNRGYTEDCRKYSEAAALDWLVIRATPSMVRDGEALRLFKAALYVRGWQ